ncbi:MAG TPA: hypothetical protein VN437_03460, partial [Rectinemataceae bacterium]|nr:hypothetical protein [Rectinemataceae bacterium]
SMGLSFILSDPDMDWAGRLFWHNGATIVFRSHLEVLPDHGLAAFVVCNSTGGGQVVETITKKLLATSLRLKRGQVPPDMAVVEAPILAEIPPRILESFAGIYVNDGKGEYEIVEMTPEGLLWTKVSTDLAGGRARGEKLVACADGLFRPERTPGLAFEFKEVSGRFLMIAHKKNASAVFGERYIPGPLPEAWKARVGRWIAGDLAPADFRNSLGGGQAITLSLADGMLVMENDGALVVVAPVSDDAAYIRGLGRVGGSSVRAVVENGVEKMRFLMATFQRADEGAAAR